MKKFGISILTVVMVVSIIFTGCAGGAEEPEAQTTTALPKPGEWTAATGTTKFTFTFTVSSDSTNIPKYSYQFTGFECEFKGGRTQMSGGVMAEISPPRPITGGQFTLDWDEMIRDGPDWDIVIQGRFDETGRHASGTWEVSSEGTTCQKGTWEASAP